MKVTIKKVVIVFLTFGFLTIFINLFAESNDNSIADVPTQDVTEEPTDDDPELKLSDDSLIF